MENASISSSIPICAATVPTHSDPSSDRATRANSVCYFYYFIPNKGWFHFHQAHYLGKFSPLTVRQKYRGRLFFFSPQYSTSKPYLDLGSTGLGAGPGNAVLSTALKLFVIFRRD